MNSGLYALAGASATATAAAWANRLLEPMTKVSNVYFGLSRVGSLARAPGSRPVPGASPAGAGSAGTTVDGAPAEGETSTAVSVSRLGSTTTASRSSCPTCSESTAEMTCRRRASMTSLA